MENATPNTKPSLDDSSLVSRLHSLYGTTVLLTAIPPTYSTMLVFLSTLDIVELDAPTIPNTPNTCLSMGIRWITFAAHVGGVGFGACQGKKTPTVNSSNGN